MHRTQLIMINSRSNSNLSLDGYTISRNGNDIVLEITGESMIRFYIDECFKWFASDQSKQPPHPYILIDKVAEDIATIVNGNVRLDRYSNYFRTRLEHYSFRGTAVFSKEDNNYGYYAHAYQIDTQNTGALKFHLHGDLFDPVHPNWSRPVFEYKYTKMKTKEKHEIWFRDFGAYSCNSSIIKKLSELTEHCPCNPRYFLMRFISYSSFLCYVCPICGKKYFCDCFLPLKQNWRENRKWWLKRYPDLDENTEYRHGICHVCRSDVPPPVFGHKMYISFFMQKYAPWVFKEAYIQHGISGMKYLKSRELRDAENHVRKQLGVYKIGEKWISETALYYLIRTLCADSYDVIHHARPAFLNGMEYDVYIPELKLAFEYDGVQHHRAVDFFGGEGSYSKTKERDQAKNDISEKHKIKLIRVKEGFSENQIDLIIKAQEDKCL